MQICKLIGLDPGLRFLGWGIIEMRGQKMCHIANGSITSNAKLSLAERLLQLEQGLEKVFEEWQPQHAAVEQSFVNGNGASTLKLGQARAVCLLVPARRGLPIAEYAPNFIKKSIVGSGHADKQQMMKMMSILLPQAKPKDEHAVDALAIAMTLAHTNNWHAKRLIA